MTSGPGSVAFGSLSTPGSVEGTVVRVDFAGIVVAIEAGAATLAVPPAVSTTIGEQLVVPCNVPAGEGEADIACSLVKIPFKQLVFTRPAAWELL